MRHYVALVVVALLAMAIQVAWVPRTAARVSEPAQVPGTDPMPVANGSALPGDTAPGSGTPLPAEDPPAPGSSYQAPSENVAGFYLYPSVSKLEQKQDGEVLAAEPMTVSESLQHASSRALRMMYRSRGIGGEPAAVTGFLLIPQGQPPAQGWPVVAWAHGTSGVGPDCAPSRWASLYPGDDAYEHLIARLLSNGFAVVGTDYPGLGFPGQVHPYLQQDPEGQAVIDSVRAARNVAPNLGQRWFAVGHSQGGQAALAAGERALSAPDLQFLGTISIAPASNLASAFDALARVGPEVGGSFYILAAYGSYVAASAKLFAPSLQYTDLLSPQLAAEMPAAKRLCLVELSLYLSNLDPPLESIGNPNWASNPALQQFVASAEPAQQRSAGPILLLQGDRDNQVSPQLTGTLYGELCGLGDVVQYRTYAGADHDSILSQAYPDIAQWLSDRLLGGPAEQTCTPPP